MEFSPCFLSFSLKTASCGCNLKDGTVCAFRHSFYQRHASAASTKLASPFRVYLKPEAGASNLAFVYSFTSALVNWYVFYLHTVIYLAYHVLVDELYS